MSLSSAYRNQVRKKERKKKKGRENRKTKVGTVEGSQFCGEYVRLEFPVVLIEETGKERLRLQVRKSS